MADAIANAGPDEARARRANARARPVSEVDSSGAPQPSTATCSTGSPVVRAKVSAMACCSGWSAAR